MCPTTIIVPEYCPNPACEYFSREAAAAVRWWRRAGSFDTLCRGAIQRFRCPSCGKTCSTQTCSIHYWTHSTCRTKKCTFLAQVETGFDLTPLCYEPLS